MKKITLLTTKPNCLLSLNARIIYSHLVYRGRFGKGMTRKEIAAAWRLNRTRDVNAALSELDAHSLVARKGNRLFANEPPTGWFANKAKPQKKWQDTLAGFPLPLRGSECKLTLRPWVAYWLVCHQSNLPKSMEYRYKYVAIALGCAEHPADEATSEVHPKRTTKYSLARSAIKKLVALGLVEQRFYHAKKFRLRVVGQIPATWLVPKKPTEESVPTTVSPEPARTARSGGTVESAPASPPLIDCTVPGWMMPILTELQSHGLKPQFMRTLRTLMTAVEQLDTARVRRGVPPVGYGARLYREAKTQNTTQPHCAFLYHSKLKELLEQEAIRCREAKQARERASTEAAESRVRVIQTYGDARTTPLTKGARGDDHIACMCSFRYRGIQDPPLDKWLDRYGEQVIREYLATCRFDPDERFNRQLPPYLVEVELEALRPKSCHDDLLAQLQGELHYTGCDEEEPGECVFSE